MTTSAEPNTPFLYLHFLVVFLMTNQIKKINVKKKEKKKEHIYLHTVMVKQC
jgi:hypothetical protein